MENLKDTNDEPLVVGKTYEINPKINFYQRDAVRQQANPEYSGIYRIDRFEPSPDFYEIWCTRVVPNDNAENWFTVKYDVFTPKEVVVMGGRKSKTHGGRRRSRKSKKSRRRSKK
jgi:hypothetical protein